MKFFSLIQVHKFFSKSLFSISICCFCFQCATLQPERKPTSFPTYQKSKSSDPLLILFIQSLSEKHSDNLNPFQFFFSNPHLAFIFQPPSQFLFLPLLLHLLFRLLLLLHLSFISPITPISKCPPPQSISPSLSSILLLL